MNEQQLEKLTEVFRIIFNDNALILKDEMVAADVPGWDSFQHINLLISIEEEFEVIFTNDEVAKMQKVGDLKNKLNEKLS